MRPVVESPFTVRGVEFGGARPLFCVPLVAEGPTELLAQANVAHEAGADLVEWRADFYKDVTAAGLVECCRGLRSVLAQEPIIFTLRIGAEGGAQELSQEVRRTCIESVAASGLVDMVDVELRNGIHFIEPVVRTAHEHGVRVILSFHDFDRTPADQDLMETISAMSRSGADVAKLAVMPQSARDVLRLLGLTLAARTRFPRLPLCTMSMGPLGTLTRVAGFLFGSDMAFAAGQQASAPGQIPIAEARALAANLLNYSRENP